MKNTLILLGFLAFSPNLTFAGDHGHGHHKGMACGNVKKEDLAKEMKKHHDKFLKKLDLTKEQKAQVDKLHQDHSELIYAQTQKAAAAHTEVVSAVEKNSPNEVIRERMTNFQKEKQGVMSAKLDLMFAIRDLLTPEQKQKAANELKEKMADWCD